MESRSCVISHHSIRSLFLGRSRRTCKGSASYSRTLLLQLRVLSWVSKPATTQQLSVYETARIRKSFISKVRLVAINEQTNRICAPGGFATTVAPEGRGLARLESESDYSKCNKCKQHYRQRGVTRGHTMVLVDVEMESALAETCPRRHTLPPAIPRHPRGFVARAMDLRCVSG